MKTASSARSTHSAAPGNNHYVVLDGLWAVVSPMVLAFHTLEPFSHGDATKQIINHGYFAVDFFFMLSGFVISYAYDDPWGRMTQWGFYKRRLIRLQPMVSSWEV
jgi:peptidoglycan/LPS O-acetylase OafA/YrhL